MQEFGLINLLLKILTLMQGSSASLFQGTECLVTDLHPELISGCAKGQRLQWLMT